MTQEKFIEALDEKGYSYKIEDERVVVDFNGDVILNNLKELPSGTIFANGGGVNLSLKKLPSDVIFENNGITFLGNLKKLPSGTIFKNRGDVYLNYLEKLSSDAIFENDGIIFIHNLDLVKGTQGSEKFRELFSIKDEYI